MERGPRGGGFSPSVLSKLINKINIKVENMAGIKKKVAVLFLNTKQGYITGEVSRNYLINGKNMFTLDNKDPVSNSVFFFCTMGTRVL